jgi:hypothetical protein
MDCHLIRAMSRCRVVHLILLPAETLYVNMTAGWQWQSVLPCIDSS